MTPHVIVGKVVINGADRSGWAHFEIPIEAQTLPLEAIVARYLVPAYLAALQIAEQTA
jgi:hypothetical protein